MSQTVVVSDFEDLGLSPGTFWNGSDGSGGFVSGEAFFLNDHNAEWGTWSGWSYSSMPDDTTAGLFNQYSAITASGLDPVHSGGSTYAVAYAGWGGSSVRFVKDEPYEVRGLYVTNSTYTALSMRDGDDYSKKFGGPDGEEPDWFLLTVTGLLDGEETARVHFYLADFRSDNPDDDYIVTRWEWIDLSPLGHVDELFFSLTSSDVGDWGMNTPAYFCIDNLTVAIDAPSGPNYIARIIEYIPAPGQLINKAPWGLPGSAESLVGGTNGTLSLGAFGGYVEFAFERPVHNHPDNPYGIDFIILGNASSVWSEPGVVWVQKDEDGNGIPDGIWHELAGSDYHFSSTLRGYQVQYTNPGGQVAVDVPWTDNLGGSGFVVANSFSSQPYYPWQANFPDIDQASYTLTGTRIDGHLENGAGAMITSGRRAFGYADNQVRGSGPFEIPDNPYTSEVEHAGGDAFDISWAVDADGNYVELDMIHFVRVQTAMLTNAGWLGEVSTEVTGAVATDPNPDISGEMDMVVIKDLPAEIPAGTFQLEAYAFHGGRLRPERQIEWTTDKSDAFVDDKMQLTVSTLGEIMLTARLAKRPEILATAKVLVVDALPVKVHENMLSPVPVVFPNPARDAVWLTTALDVPLQIFDATGVQLLALNGLESGAAIDISGFPAGLYLVRILYPQGTQTLRFVK